MGCCCTMLVLSYKPLSKLSAILKTLPVFWKVIISQIMFENFDVNFLQNFTYH